MESSIFIRNISGFLVLLALLIIPLSFDRTFLRVERSERCPREGDQGVLWRSRDRFSRFPIDQSSRGTTVGVRSDLHFMVERGRWEEVIGEARRCYSTPS